MLMWTWRVPDAAGDARWRGSVGCWSDGGDAGREPADVERPFAIEVEGSPGGAPALVAPGTLTVQATGIDPTDARPRLEKWADIAQILTFGATALGLLAVWWQIRLARSQARSERMGQMFDRLNNAEFKALWSKVLAYLGVDDEAACVERIRLEEQVATGNDPLLRGDHPVALNDILTAHDAYEEAGLLFNEGTLDRATMIRAVGQSLISSCLAGWWWINYNRSADPLAARWVRKRRFGAYAEWERMVKTMVAHNLTPRADLENEWQLSRVRVICLPRCKDPTLTQWREAGRLSKAIGDVLRAPKTNEADLERFLVAQVAPRCDLPDPFTPAARTILVPPWPELLTLPSRPRRGAIAVGAWWDERREKSGGSPAALVLVQLDPGVRALRRSQELAWRLDYCRDKVGDECLAGRLRKVVDKNKLRSGAGIEPPAPLRQGS
jgi:hypothetical protein